MDPAAIEDIAATLGGGLTPPEILKRLGYKVLRCRSSTEEFASRNLRTRTLALLVRSSEQEAWHGLLHEAFEVELPRYLGPGHEDHMEHAARAAAIDRRMFHDVIAGHGPDLLKLQQVFPYAPPTQLALRFTDLFDDCAAGSWLMEDGMLREEVRISRPSLALLPEADWVEKVTLQNVYAKRRTTSVLHRARVVGHGWRIRTWGPRHCLVVTHHRRAF